MRVVHFGDEVPKDWDQCCDESSQAWLYHRADWIRIESEVLGASNLSFAIRSRQGIVAVQPLYLTHLGLVNFTERLIHSGLHRHTGLACRDDASSLDVKMAQSAAMRRIEELAVEHSADRIQLNVQNLAPRSFTHAREEVPFWVLEHQFQLGLRFGPMGIHPSPGMSTCAADQIIDLSATEEELFGKLDPACRKAIRKAEEYCLSAEVVCSDLEGSIDSYYAIALQSAERTGESLASELYFRNLAKLLGPRGRLAIVFVVQQGRRVAAVLLGIDKGCATFMGGVSAPDSLHMRPNDFAHWSAISWAKLSGLYRYKLGPIFPEVPEDWPIARVSRFKQKFGGTSYSTIQGSRFLAPDRYLAGGK